MEILSLKPTVYIVGGLLFGDEGKGTTVEYLVKEKKAKLVVRFGGGPQAAHHIVLTNGVWHCFSQFGSGSFSNDCSTLIGRYMIIYPHTLIREAKKLIENGATDVIQRLYIDKECFIITPYHQLYNRVSEALRGNNSHGTTGMGVGITTDEAFRSYPNYFPKGEICHSIDINKPVYTCLRVEDLMNKDSLPKKLQVIISEKIQQIRSLMNSYTEGKLIVFDKDYMSVYKNIEFNENNLKEANELFFKCINDHTINSLCKFYQSFVNEYTTCFVDGNNIIEGYLNKGENIVFEGSQGSLLDRIHGIYPHITKSLCSDDNAMAILNEIKAKYQLVKIGVLRAYSSRHGNGPFITHDKSWNEFISEDHNMNSRWQGNFKVGPFDLIGARYGISIFKPDYISLTCIDKMLTASKECESIKQFPICVKYRIPKQLDAELEEILNKQDTFETESDDNYIYIKNISKRRDEEGYLSYDLLKILNIAEPILQNTKDINSNPISIKKDSMNTTILSKLKTENNETILNVAEYIEIIEKLISVPIGILSLGPTNEDKVFIQNI